MLTRKLVIIGDSLFADTLLESIGNSESVEIVGTAANPEESETLIRALSPDVVIVAGTELPVSINLILNNFPDLPIIHASLSKNQVYVITNHSIDSSIKEILNAISELPQRGHHDVVGN